MNECIEYLKKENNIKDDINLSDEDALRALMNITMPENLCDEYYQKQDELLQKRLSNKKIVDCNDLPFLKPKISLYQGDITLIKADAIVNACNEKLLGCFRPLHGCIDNAIHSYAGLQVRRDLMQAMALQGHDEPNGKCKVTKGYNLPSSYIFHTVGPRCFGYVNKESEKDLRSCYRSCLDMAEMMKLKSIVFCSISTGVYGYPIEQASKVALIEVSSYLKEHPESTLERVIFNVFSDSDRRVYERTIEKMD